MYLVNMVDLYMQVVTSLICKSHFHLMETGQVYLMRLGLGLREVMSLTVVYLKALLQPTPHMEIILSTVIGHSIQHVRMMCGINYQLSVKL